MFLGFVSHTVPPMCHDELIPVEVSLPVEISSSLFGRNKTPCSGRQNGSGQTVNWNSPLELLINAVYARLHKLPPSHRPSHHQQEPTSLVTLKEGSLATVGGLDQLCTSIDWNY